MLESYNAKETARVLSTPGEAVYTSTETPNVCPNVSCGRTFNSKKGLNVHFAMKHKGDCVHTPSVVALKQSNKKWTLEELSLVCQVEWQLRALNRDVTSRVIYDLMVESGLTRSYDALDRQRRNKSYKDLRESLFLKWDNLVTMREGRRSPDPRASGSKDLLTALQAMMTEGTLDEPLDPIDSELNALIEKASQGKNICAELETLMSKIFPCNVVEEAPRNRGIAKPLNRKDRKNLVYKRFQQLYCRNRRRAANDILDGKSSGGVKPGEIPGFTEHWAGSLESPTAATEVSNMTRTQEGTYEEVWDPISLEELNEAIMTIPNDKAPGPDGVSVKKLKGMSRPVLVKLLNLIMLNGKVPDVMKVSNTIFIPKKNDASLPKDFRPISLSPMILRVFNKIIAKRMVGFVNLDHRQKAFLPIDGCCENIVLLDHILSDAKKKRKTVIMATLDMNNAFGSIHHAALVRALECNGAPKPLVEYVRDLYSGFITNLKVGNESTPVQVRRGILQGDPLSPILFNLVIDQLLRMIPDESGYELEQGLRANGMGFADDLVLLCCSELGMKVSLRILDDNGIKWGLSFNSDKSSYLALVSERSKCLQVQTGFKFEVGGNKIHPIEHGEPWRYLGAFFSSQGLKDAPDMLRMWLMRLKKSLLKPQQRLYVLRTHLLPKLIFRLCMSKISGRKLNKLDRVVRSFLTGKNGILHLPGDTPISFFYAPITEGGLGLMRLRHSIPSMIVTRFGRLVDSDDTLLRSAALGHSNTLRVKKAESLLVSKGEINGLGAANIQEINAALLHERVDGYGLKRAREVPYVHTWIGDGSMFLDGKTFCDALKLRIGALPTRSRLTRGRTLNKECRAGCTVPETIAHISQRCHRTDGARIRRHDRVVSVLAKGLRNLGYSVTMTPIFKTDDGNRKPDIVAVKDGKVFVIDPTICGESVNPDIVHKGKVDKYNKPDILKTLEERHVGHQIHFGSLTITYRGIVGRESEKFLRSMGVTKATLRRAVLVTLEGTVKCFRWFMMSCEMKPWRRCGSGREHGARN